MNDYFDIDSARAVYENKETEDLVRIAFLNDDDFRSEAVELARSELASRGIHSADDTAVEQERSVLSAETAQAEDLAHQPLGPGLKIVCLIFAGFAVAVIIAVSKRAAGKIRASNQAWWCFAVGVAWKASLIIYLVQTS